MFDWFKDPPAVKSAVDMCTTLKNGMKYRKTIVRTSIYGYDAKTVMQNYLNSHPTMLEISFDEFVPVSDIARVTLENFQGDIK